MRYLALACDYDGTLAFNGRVNAETLKALQRLQSSGRRLILVTGRRLPELLSVFTDPETFDLIVAENGAVLYHPKSRSEKVLAEPVPEAFIRLLRQRDVQPLQVGRVVVATWQPCEGVVLQTIQELGFELQVIFNKGAVMVLPTGINKASGLRAALDELKLSAHNVVGIGDAENDHAFLNLCECSVAVANALPALKKNADWVTQSGHGEGVIELIEELLRSDLRHLDLDLPRHHIVVGMRDQVQTVKISAYGHNLLVAGTSDAGKSTLATSLVKQLVEANYQCCVIDPEGDYEPFEGALVLGSAQRAPSVEEVLQMLEEPKTKLVVNLLGFPRHDRPAFLLSLLPRLQELRSRLGRPHWLVIDEAHHMLGRECKPAALAACQEMRGMIFLTAYPNELGSSVLSTADVAIVVGKEPPGLLMKVNSTAAMYSNLSRPSSSAGIAEALFWSKDDVNSPFMISLIPRQTEWLRHRRKYVEGDLGPEKSFYFTGPEKKLNLRAGNLIVFLDLAENIDAATWNYHLHRGDFARWFRDVIKDQGLAEEASRVQRMLHLPSCESRTLIRVAIEQKYTLPTKAEGK